MTERTILIAAADDTISVHLAAHLDADGHTVHLAASAEATVAKLTTRAIDLMVLAELELPAQHLGCLRRLRTGRLHVRVHPAQPVVTLGAADRLALLHAYEAGSDHHLASDTDYLVVRAVIATITRRTADEQTDRHFHVGALHIDTVARTVDYDGQPIRLSALQYALLCRLASDPSQVFTGVKSSAASGTPGPTAQAARWTTTPATCAGACAFRSTRRDPQRVGRRLPPRPRGLTRWPRGRHRPAPAAAPRSRGR